LAANLAGLAWLSVAGLVLLAVAARDAPEGTTGFAVAVLMPYALVPALGVLPWEVGDAAGGWFAAECGVGAVVIVDV
jgi:hypothetical protein